MNRWKHIQHGLTGLLNPSCASWRDFLGCSDPRLPLGFLLEAALNLAGVAFLGLVATPMSTPIDLLPLDTGLSPLQTSCSFGLINGDSSSSLLSWRSFATFWLPTFIDAFKVPENLTGLFRLGVPKPRLARLDVSALAGLSCMRMHGLSRMPSARPATAVREDATSSKRSTDGDVQLELDTFGETTLLALWFDDVPLFEGWEGVVLAHGELSSFSSEPIFQHASDILVHNKLKRIAFKSIASWKL